MSVISKTEHCLCILFPEERLYSLAEFHVFMQWISTLGTKRKEQISQN